MTFLNLCEFFNSILTNCRSLAWNCDRSRSPPASNGSCSKAPELGILQVESFLVSKPRLPRSLVDLTESGMSWRSGYQSSKQCPSPGPAVAGRHPERPAVSSCACCVRSRQSCILARAYHSSRTRRTSTTSAVGTGTRNSSIDGNRSSDWRQILTV